MIEYSTGGIFFILNLFKLSGSVFPKAILVATPCALFTAGLRYLLNEGNAAGWFRLESTMLPGSNGNGEAWSGFSFLVGFLIVFRTSQSYNRFWEGCTSTQEMRAQWLASCSSLVAFCRHSKRDPTLVHAFQNTLVRLFSMLHAAALGEIEDTSSKDIESIEAFKFELIDVEGIDEDSLISVMESRAKAELIFQWIQQLIVENIKVGVLSIPAPILSRSFQEMANGMVAFHDAMKISYVPFPFPYAQTCDCLLILHFMITPFVLSQWMNEPVWAGVFSFVQVFILWALNFIAVELQNPFGMDANDIDGRAMQMEMNEHLLLLLRPITLKLPELTTLMQDLHSPHIMSMSSLRATRSSSFSDIWSRVSSGSASRAAAAVGRRFSNGSCCSQMSAAVSYPTECTEYNCDKQNGVYSSHCTDLASVRNSRNSRISVSSSPNAVGVPTAIPEEASKSGIKSPSDVASRSDNESEPEPAPVRPTNIPADLVLSSSRAPTDLAPRLSRVVHLGQDPCYPEDEPRPLPLQSTRLHEHLKHHELAGCHSIDALCEVLNGGQEDGRAEPWPPQGVPDKLGMKVEYEGFRTEGKRKSARTTMPDSRQLATASNEDQHASLIPGRSHGPRYAAKDSLPTVAVPTTPRNRLANYEAAGNSALGG